MKQIDKYIGKNIRHFRLVHKMSQECLAKKLGITFQQIQKYEKGINRVAASRLYDIARVFRVDINKFYAGRK